jgi:hypothetical protein
MSRLTSKIERQVLGMCMNNVKNKYPLQTDNFLMEYNELLEQCSDEFLREIGLDSAVNNRNAKKKIDRDIKNIKLGKKGMMFDNESESFGEVEKYKLKVPKQIAEIINANLMK